MDVRRPTRLFVLPHLGSRPDVRLLDRGQERSQERSSVLFKQLPEDFALDGFVLVDRPEDADFFIAPQAAKERTPELERYLDESCALARTHGKFIIIFLTGDYAHTVHLDRPELLVFKATEYERSRRPNEIVFAPFVEDLGIQVPRALRAKGERPVVSFCGYAGLAGWKAKLKYHAENILWSLMGDEVYKRGIYFRKKAMHALVRDLRVETRFIVRNSFSGNLATAVKDAATIRAEYVDSIVGSDFVLCPKGDANYSSRFFETLSLGRIPVLIDTDMRLPFQNRIDYSRFIIRVPYQETGRTGDYIMKLWESLSDEEFKAMQDRARTAFREHLRYDAYFNEALPLLREGGAAAVL